MSSKYKSSFQRLIKIDELIRTGSFPSSESLANKLKVSMRTIQRDILYMQSELSAPIMYDAEKRGYFYMMPHFTIGDINFTEDDVSILTMAQSLLESVFEGSFYKSKISKQFYDLYSRATNMLVLSNKRVLPAMQFATPATVDFSLIEKIVPYIYKKECMVIECKNTKKEKIIKPVRLFFIKDFWCLLFYEEKFSKPEDFKLWSLSQFDFKRPSTKTEGYYFPDIFNFDTTEGTPFGEDHSYVHVVDESDSFYVEIKLDTGQSFFLLQYLFESNNSFKFIKNERTTKTGMMHRKLMKELDKDFDEE